MNTPAHPPAVDTHAAAVVEYLGKHSRISYKQIFQMFFIQIRHATRIGKRVVELRPDDIIPTRNGLTRIQGVPFDQPDPMTPTRENYAAQGL